MPISGIPSASRLIGLVGIALCLLAAFLVSNGRKFILWKRVFMGLALQMLFAISLLGIPSLGIPGVFRFIFMALSSVVTNLVDTVGTGSKFLFGPLAEVRDPWGFVFAFRVLPTIIFFSALMALLYYLGILQRVVKGFAWVMQKTLQTSGAETLSGTANIFMGQTEAPLLVRPYIAGMTRSEIYCLMVGGMSTLPAGVEAAYIGLLKGRMPDIAGHLMTASVLGAMGGLVISKIIFPEQGTPVTAGKVELNVERVDTNPLEALSRGASEGVTLALNVAAMLIAFIALIAIFNSGLTKIGDLFHLTEPLTFSLILGKLCRPLAWLIGVPWSEASQVGLLIGEKIVINEFVAYVHLSEMGPHLADRTVLIASYALCGFANFSSIGIQIGGIGAMAPNQRPTLAKLGLLAVFGGTLACFLSACLAGLLF